MKKVCSVNLEKDLLDKIEKVKRKFGWSRSTLVNELLKRTLPKLEDSIGIDEIIKNQ